MFDRLINFFYHLTKSRVYWIFLLVTGTGALSFALYSQYVRHEMPCVVCIQIRLWVSLLIIVSLFGWYFRNNRILNSLCNFSLVAIAAGMTERSYLLLGTERGFVFADCGFDLGLPAWFDVESWLPWMYRIETSCGYTPEVAFGITMAEALMVSSVIFLLLSVAGLLAGFKRSDNRV